MSKLILDCLDRQVIRGFTLRSRGKSKWWIWWNKPRIVNDYEILKESRNLQKGLEEGFSSLVDVVVLGFLLGTALAIIIALIILNYEM
jgi:hypothetical protein